jgi:hypothetical protein
MQLVRVWPGKNRGIVPMMVSLVAINDGVFITDVLVPAHHNRAYEVRRGWRRLSFEWEESLGKFVDAANRIDGGYLLFRDGDSYYELTRTGEPGAVAELIYP